MGPDPIILVRIHNAAFDKTSPVYYFRFQAKAGGSGSGQDREATVRDYLRSREGCLLVAPLLISDADPDLQYERLPGSGFVWRPMRTQDADPRNCIRLISEWTHLGFLYSADFKCSSIS